jgi:maleylacetate reductase
MGGTLYLLHAQTHAVVLPHAVAYNRSAVHQIMVHLALALRVTDAAQGLFDLALRLRVPTSLRALGIVEDDLDRICAAAFRSPYPNPRELTCEGIRHLLEQAYLGQRPDALDTEASPTQQYAAGDVMTCTGQARFIRDHARAAQ